MKEISIIIVTHNRVEKLKRLLQSLQDQFPHAEKIVIINQDNSEKYQALREVFSIQWIEGSFKTPGCARNSGIERASGKWLLFLDDDVDIPKGFAETSESYLKTIDQTTVLFGGPDQPYPNQSIFSQALSLTLTSPLATAHTRLRHTQQTQEIRPGDESNLILCNLWVRKSLVDTHQIRFNEELFRNEENLFITESLSHHNDAKALYIPELYVYHERKTNPLSLGRAVFSSGKNRVKSWIFSKSLFNFLFLGPALFLIYLMVIPFLNGVPNTLVPLKIYLTLSLFMSLKVSLLHKRVWPLVFLYQVFLNFFYGLGVLWGLLNFPLWFIRLRG